MNSFTKIPGQTPLENGRHERFCQEYCIHFNKTRAAINAGYSEKTARQIGYKLFTKVDIYDRIQYLRQIEAQDYKNYRVSLIRKSLLLANANLEEIVNLKKVRRRVAVGSGKNQKYRYIQFQELEVRDDLTSDDWQTVSSIKQGKDGIEIKQHDAIAAMRLAGQFLGMLDGETGGSEDELPPSHEKIMSLLKGEKAG